jgi:hypothetical protein
MPWPLLPTDHVCSLHGLVRLACRGKPPHPTRIPPWLHRTGGPEHDASSDSLLRGGPCPSHHNREGESPIRGARYHRHRPRYCADRGRGRHLQRNVRGPLPRPGEARYEETRKVWNGLIDKRPALIAGECGLRLSGQAFGRVKWPQRLIIPSPVLPAPPTRPAGPHQPRPQSQVFVQPLDSEGVM